MIARKLLKKTLHILKEDISAKQKARTSQQGGATLCKFLTLRFTPKLSQDPKSQDMCFIFKGQRDRGNENCLKAAAPSFPA